MKKFTVLMAISAMLALAGSAWAAPFLTSDCTNAADKVTGFQLQFNSDSWIDTPAFGSCGTDPATKVVCTAPAVTVCYDLASLPVGPFIVTGKAVNAWGVSSSSDPFSDTKTLPATFGPMRLIR